MPVMPESGNDSSAAARDKNTKKQYEELGRFVVAFEEMINDVRELCIFILADLDLSLQTFVSVAFHHQALTAKPLLDIIRTLIAEVGKDKDARKKYKIEDNSQKIMEGVLDLISKEYMDLANTRNNLLHGTWYVGFTGPEDLEGREFYVKKLGTTKTGLTPLELPKTDGELHDLTKRCGKVRYWLLSINSCFMLRDGAERLKKKFWYDAKKKQWWAHTPTGDETLP